MTKLQINDKIQTKGDSMTEKEFFEELAKNDEIVKKEHKSYSEQNKEFAEFIANNNVKIKGGKHGRK